NIHLAHGLIVESGSGQDAAVNPRVQGLDASRHDFRKAGVVRDLRDFHVPGFQSAAGSARGNQFHAAPGQRGCEFGQTICVGNTDQRPSDGRTGVLFGLGGTTQFVSILEWSRRKEMSARNRTWLLQAVLTAFRAQCTPVEAPGLPGSRLTAAAIVRDRGEQGRLDLVEDQMVKPAWLLAGQTLEVMVETGGDV